ncbi:2,3-bisphosphoglycerate-dependent phosphoglycerate mutase [Flavobacterium restrictum]|uniref:2,3-bisphosphoglycerate-dependent phosphoglycerate mutase n=1 Tax=Flavobacterium restrictum TaxID=2594428 RepID=A0A553EEB4_9FLAO|nr:2,3-bisphosphoglycerate-dependent phosphoglycerate mutase [Flavobacterium restrictum]TRX43143.1 2,3-bisphosphoglycerate-dependent phosphoglycerate mutase [Flavobacterium restrictum]
MATLILIRHGQSIYNLENRFTGSLDIGLTALGAKEAQWAGQKLVGYTFDFAYTSTLKRAQESLRIILEEIHQNNIPIILDKALNERDYGSLQGLNKDETIAKYGLKQVEIWRRSYAIRPPNGESLEDTFKRTIPFYQHAIEPQLKLDQTILIVAHGNSLRALVMYLEHISPEHISNLNIPTGIPKKYVFDANLKVLQVNYL